MVLPGESQDCYILDSDIEGDSQCLDDEKSCEGFLAVTKNSNECL